MRARLTKEQGHAKLRAKLHWLGKALRLIGAIRVHDDGDGVSAVFRWWHPVSWALWLIFLPICGVIGEKIADAVPFRLSRYFRENPERLQWL